MIELLELIGWGMLIIGFGGVLVTLFYLLIVNYIIDKYF